MAYCKIYLTLSALIICHVHANYEYERLKSLIQLESLEAPGQSHDDIYKTASSEILPNYYNSYGANKDRSSNHFKGPSKPFAISIKKKTNEKKYVKKIPSYAFINKDSIKSDKKLIPNSEIIQCQEIKIKSIWKQDESRKDICYRCRNPKNKSTYEYCLYNSPPKESTSASKKIQRFSSAPAGFRYRRSNFGRDESDYGNFQNPYRFSDEYFVDATYNIPAAYETNGEKCDKIVKNSMVCMICKDLKTNGKYEQCSYVKQPHEKAYSYSKSGSFGKSQERDNDRDENPESNSHPKFSNFEPSNQQDRNPIKEPREYSYPNEDYAERISTANQRDEVQDTPSADCKQVQKDSKTCMICKDPKIGGTYEKCIYSYQPSDKLYKYSRSATFGYPDKTSDSNRDSNKAQMSEKFTNFDNPQKSNSTHNHTEGSESFIYPRKFDRIKVQQNVNNSDGTLRDSSNYNSGYSNQIPFQEESSNYKLSSRKDVSENQEIPSSESLSEDYSENISANHCKKLQKNSMICTICKDPKTGNDFEQCSYSYQPSDKLFSYSKSRSFGNTRESDKPEQAQRKDEQLQDNFDIVKDFHDEYIPGQDYEASTIDKAKSEGDEKEKKEVNVKYLDTARKKIEIEEFMQKFQNKDRSKCKKIIRDKMTCYQCIDEDGFQKEECAFVAGQIPNNDHLAFHEIKEFQIAPTSHVHDFKLPSTIKSSTMDPLETSASASRNTYIRIKKPDNDYPDETSHIAEEMKESEPYDYTSETKSVYDKILGLTLPAYMFSTSEHEAAFDEIVTSNHNQR